MLAHIKVHSACVMLTQGVSGTTPPQKKKTQCPVRYYPTPLHPTPHPPKVIAASTGPEQRERCGVQTKMCRMLRAVSGGVSTNNSQISAQVIFPSLAVFGPFRSFSVFSVWYLFRICLVLLSTHGSILWRASKAVMEVVLGSSVIALFAKRCPMSRWPRLVGDKRWPA